MNLGDSFQRATDGFFAFLPNLLGFLVLLLVGFIVAKLISAAVGKVLQKVGLDRALHDSDANKYVDRVMPGARPSKGIATVIFWLVFAFFLFSAIGALEIPALTTFMNQVLAYLPNVIAAIVIFVVAAMVAGAVAAGVTRILGDTPTGKIMASVVPALVMIIAVFMILEQLQIAEQIVQIAFAATMGALALGLALAFGLGGRGVAERMLEDAYRTGREHKEQAKADLQRGRDRARSADHQQSSTGETTGATGATGAYSAQGSGEYADPYAGNGRQDDYDPYRSQDGPRY